MGDLLHLLLVHLVADADEHEVHARQPAGGDLLGHLRGVGRHVVGVVELQSVMITASPRLAPAVAPAA